MNFLKLKTSAGILGYDRSTEHLLYERAWAQDGSFRFGTTNNGATAYYSTFVRAGNPNLKWEKAAEWNIGVEGLFLNNRLYTEINYFRENIQTSSVLSMHLTGIIQATLLTRITWVLS